MNDLDSLRAKVEKSLESISQTPGSDAASGGQPWNPWLISFLTILIIAFCVLVLHYMRSMLKEGQGAGDVLRLATMPMVIAAAIFLVVLGFSNEQMTPVIGLLGTMIGYILGSATAKGQTSSPTSSPPLATPPG
jgi:hypothetical protein